MKKLQEYLILVKKLIVLVKPLTGVMVLAILFGSLGHIIATAIPFVGGYGIIKVKEMEFGIKNLVIILFTFAILRSLLRYFEQLCNHYVAFKVLEIIRDKIFKALRKLAPAKMEGIDSGEMVSIITSDIELLEVFYAHTISPVLIAFIHTIFYTIVLSKFNIIYSFILLIFHIIMAILIPIITSNRARNIGDVQRKAVSDLNSSIMDTFYGIGESTQYFTGSNRRDEMILKTKKLNRASKELSKIYGENLGLSSSVIMFGNIIFMVTALYLYKNKNVDLVAMVVPMIIFMSSFGPVSALSNLANNLLTTFACGKRVINLLEEEPMVESNSRGKNIEFNDLSVEGISFSYKDEKVLDNFNLELKKGDILGLSGKSGCGKSTVLKLIMRFYDSKFGKILENGIDIKDINTESLRKNHTYITQSTHLFKGTIADNLRIAKQDATDDEILEACKKASVHDFIKDLPNGYDTEVEVLGSSLSTGEKQRISIARGFLHGGKLMLLDEPTSNIDSLNEGIILKSLWEETKDKAVIIVSHKLSTLRIANRIQKMARD
ncbi:ABC transporter ATP-binding protein [Peptoniphilus indolicus]|uniref:ABC superfamily ATP binding cassette transporter, ABC/membrane protein n=2 Tax=Peptoniphilus indolicus TaxID=33030 RepID=G4D516_9FIRM|nr:ABC transporter ATP-binding protein [Peptoniphilus indolicus]EGY79379.1 ABC superfamily ATP binding cassette transporter, ABC/membrane protein [Peptoniphilus indolicus ATCC 29427]SUB76359.1 Probable ABC transporter ATP-binding protein HI_0664 [Peptoniphilus indolicus]